MKSFKSLVVAAMVGAIAFTSTAMAGTPTAVKATDGKVYGTELVVRIEKDTNSGNRVRLQYINGAYQFAEDNASWSVYAKFLGGLTKPVAAPASNNGLVYDTAKGGKFDCTGGQSTVTWPTNANPDYVADSCALDTAVKQASQ
ncbi:MAG: hypothetical protein ACRC8N_10435 [Aeromonas veronii]